MVSANTRPSWSVKMLLDCLFICLVLGTSYCADTVEDVRASATANGVDGDESTTVFPDTEATTTFDIDPEEVRGRFLGSLNATAFNETDEGIGFRFIDSSG